MQLNTDSPKSVAIARSHDKNRPAYLLELFLEFPLHYSYGAAAERTVAQYPFESLSLSVSIERIAIPAGCLHSMATLSTRGCESVLRSRNHFGHYLRTGSPNTIGFFKPDSPHYSAPRTPRTELSQKIIPYIDKPSNYHDVAQMCSWACNQSHNIPLTVP